jgi:hypothetical protein
MGALDTVGGHLDIDAVLDPQGALRIRGAAVGQSGRDVNRLNACRIERRRVIDELTGSSQFWRAGHPVGVGFGYHHPALVGYFFFQGGYVGEPVPGGQTDLEVLPVNEKGYVVTMLERSIFVGNKS